MVGTNDIDDLDGIDASKLAAVSIVQRGNLKTLEKTLRKQWRMGQNIVLCWSSDERGLLVILVPHYFLGNYCASTGGELSDPVSDNEAFVRDLISGSRRKTRDELFSVSQRLDISPTFIKLSSELSENEKVLDAVEELIRRYGLSFVEVRAVLLFDIADFSLCTPFEQASQLNSLSYSLNSAYNKLLANGIEINFARTTTGDGYYVWNRDVGPFSCQDLFLFMLLVVADNATARAVSRGNTVPVIRTAFHIGSHYELYQAEGVNPTVFSYIVGNVTIELARMVDLAQPNQILIGDFTCTLPGRDRGAVPLSVAVDSPGYVRSCDRELERLIGTQFSGKSVKTMSCYLTGGQDGEPRRFRITDKHGLTRIAYNLQVDMDLDGQALALGLDDAQLPGRSAVEEAVDDANSPETQGAGPNSAAADKVETAEALFDDLASMLRRRAKKSITED
ncbi:MAG: class 3 adenylate cyclase [Alcanivorax sp.]|jgi:class 3 adenylate cyclase